MHCEINKSLSFVKIYSYDSLKTNYVSINIHIRNMNEYVHNKYIIKCIIKYIYVN